MNIFYLSKDPDRAAKLQCDKHIVKMPLETAQLLSTAHVELDLNQVAYRATHKNHPSAVWARSNRSNYKWLVEHFKALCFEYQDRYGKVHKSFNDHIDALKIYPENLPEGAFYPPPQCMPDECKRDDAVLGYRVYYKHKADEWAKRGMSMKWKGKEEEWRTKLKNC